MKRGQGQPALWRLDDGEAPRGPHVALVPGADTPLLPVDLPDTLKGIARERVGRRLLAEALGLPSETVEIRPCLRTASGWDRAVVADAGQLADWRSRLMPGCTALLPDFAALPCHARVWTVLVEDGMVRARLGETDGFSAEPDLAALLLADAAPPEAVLRLGAPDAAVDAAIAAIGVPVHHDAAALQAAGNAAPLGWAQATAGLDLMTPPQAGFDRIRARLRRWAAPAVAAALALAVWLGGIAWETADLAARARAAQDDTMAMVRTHFVPSGPILDIRAQVERALAEAAAPDAPDPDALLLFQTAAPWLTGDGIELQSIAWQPETGLVASIALRDFATLEQIVADLQSAGFEVEQQDTGVRSGGGVSARLRLDPAGA
ncbi:type II secretion system protein GspL [Psychromarinibacter halotolerans]|uniref:Type II secretion system protein GspL n=1 Tax=Psychromarinibacter halotolerans TaxID=1775175 RepID=A0ABV7GZA3_9RHOB|nr:type II secretion system protein GspL [Psychromarinibacter halotolerans]MDF0596409.1 type II secretion system protein GspL [Psychromarinibacter halotolerans]